MALARSVSRGAMIDVDDIRHLVVAGHAAPWEGDEGRLQQRVGVANACDLVRRFRSAEIAVVLADFVTAETAEIYRELLPDLEIVRLRLSLPEARRRARRRQVSLTEREFENLYALDATGTFPVDHVIDVTGLDVDAQITAVRSVWRSDGA